jgi:S1-C subfamily serine protease
VLFRSFLLLALLATGCGDAPESDLKLVTIESPAAVGLSLRELPPSVLKSIGLSYGLAVVRAEGMAERAGLRMGDVVYEVNQQRLHSVDDFRRSVTQAGESAATRLLVRRGRNDFYVAMDFGGVPMPRRPAPNSRDTLLRT